MSWNCLYLWDDGDGVFSHLFVEVYVREYQAYVRVQSPLAPIRENTRFPTRIYDINSHSQGMHRQQI